jgi:hypothetical protein
MVALFKNQYINRWIPLFLLTVLFMFFNHLRTNAQEMPPRPIGVSMMQKLSFGAFFQGLTGGNVIIDPSGFRSATGDIVLLNLGYLYFPAIFELEGNPGSIIHFLAGPDALLTGSNGGSLTLHIGDSYPLDPLIINVAPPGRMQVRVGGILSVGNPLANPAGSYTGSFMVMFIQE